MFKKKFKSLLNPTKKIAGLDIGSSSIKIMEIEGEDLSSAKLTAYAIENIPPELINPNDPGDVHVIEALGELVKKCWKKSGISSKEVAICLSSSSVINKVLTIPIYDNEEELNFGIEVEIGKYLPSSMTMDEITLDYYIIDENREEGVCTVVVIAAKKDKIEEKVAIIQSAGLVPAILDIEQYSLQNLLILMKGDDFHKKTYMLFDTSATALRMFVYKNGVLNTTREVEIGGYTLTRSLMENLDISQQESENFKIRRDGDEVFELIESKFIDNYTSEMARLIQMYSSAAIYPEIDEIILFGGVANTPGIIEALIDEIGDLEEKKIKNQPYIGRPLLNINKNEKINLKKFQKEEASLFLVTALALRKFLRKY